MTRGRGVALTLFGITLGALSLFGLLRTPPQNWGLVMMAIGTDLTWLGIAFLMPLRFRRPALIYAALLAAFSVLVVTILWF